MSSGLENANHSPDMEHQTQSAQPETSCSAPLDASVAIFLEDDLGNAEELALEAERHALAIAMAESLDEDAARKAAEMPLEEWPLEDLVQRYKASAILREEPVTAATLLGSTDKAEGCDQDCRKTFIHALEFERQAKKWYPGRGTEAFFVAATKRASQAAIKAEVMARADQARKRRRTAASHARGASRESNSPKKAGARFTKDLALQIEEAKMIVYGMPNGDVPEIFQDAGGPSEDDSDVEIIQESQPIKKAKSIDIC